VLKSSDIADLLERDGDDPLVITPAPGTPAELRKRSDASVDLRLGTWFVTPRVNKVPFLNVVDESDSKDVVEAPSLKSNYVPFGGKFILHPRNFVLGVTLEWIRLPSFLAGYIVGRSSWGRRGLIIATAAGVHPGFTGCLTLELTNLGEIPIEIRPGMAISQLFLHRVAKGKVVDAGLLGGLRRPSLAKIELDDVAKILSGS
jgi:dCTP deaminase